MASNCQRLRSWDENPVHSIPVMNAGESDSSVQLVGGAPQQAGRANAVEGVVDTRLTSYTGAA